jgi:hypothetical protein
MENTLSVVKPEVLTENSQLFNSLIKQSYKQAKKQVQDGMSFIKEEISSLYDKTTNCLNRMALPVNNFLKDISQIEAEFRRELKIIGDPDNRSSDGIVHISIASATGSMEENY